MSAERRLQLLVLILRFLIGVIFLYAGFEKLLHPTRFAAAIAEYQILTSPSVITLASFALPSLEILCGIGLFYRQTASISAAVITGLLLLFIGAIIYAAVRGLEITCGCFGESVLEGNAGFSRLMEDVVLLAIALFIYFAPAERTTRHHS
jgi:putative oxidoreductase